MEKGTARPQQPTVPVALDMAHIFAVANICVTTFAALRKAAQHELLQAKAQINELKATNCALPK